MSKSEHGGLGPSRTYQLDRARLARIREDHGLGWAIAWAVGSVIGLVLLALAT